MMTLFQFTGFCFRVTVVVPEGRRDPVAYYYGTIGTQNHSKDGLLGPNSILVKYMDPVGHIIQIPRRLQTAPTPQICLASRAIL